MTALLDTNVLLRWRQITHPDSAACQELLDRSRRRRLNAVLCAQTMIEFWVVATRPQSSNGLGLSAAQATIDLDDLLTLIPCLPEPPDVLDRWRSLVRRYNVHGLPAHDARLVAVMDAHGVTDLISLNVADFTRYPHIRCTTPSQWLAANPPGP